MKPHWLVRLACFTDWYSDRYNSSTLLYLMVNLVLCLLCRTWITRVDEHYVCIVKNIAPFCFEEIIYAHQFSILRPFPVRNKCWFRFFSTLGCSLYMLCIREGWMDMVSYENCSLFGNRFTDHLIELETKYNKVLSHQVGLVIWILERYCSSFCVMSSVRFK